MKKVLAAALLCTVSAFATWDYFPIKDAGKGEVKVGVQYGMQDKESLIGLNANARFSVIEGLEIAALFSNYYFSGFPLSYSYDGESCEEVGDFKCPPSMTQPVIGLRYWLPMGVGIALDVAIPFQGEWLGGKDGEGTNLAFTPAVQYSTKFTEELELGSQLSFSIPLENGEKITPPMELGIGLEIDYSLGLVTPFVGVDVALELTKPKYDGNEDSDYKTGTGIAPIVGAIFNINEMFAADVSVQFGIGKDYYGEEMPIAIAANFSLNF